MALTYTDIPKFICDVILPPLGVFFETVCDCHLAICILLTLLGYIPGIIYAIYLHNLFQNPRSINQYSPS